jgi:choline-sulfatase
MRILYIDLDSQRPDHLGCYGYIRNTSPNIDRIANEGVRFSNLYISDAPCLPSRTALWSGRAGIHNGVINHGGAAAEPFPEGAQRGFSSQLTRTNWMSALRACGYRTATVSSFGERHSAWHWYAGFNDIHNIGKMGLETADEVSPPAMEWIRSHGQEENWFLHVNFWDAHTPYRTPLTYGNPFADQPVPEWLTEEIRQSHWNSCGPHSAQEMLGYTGEEGGLNSAYPRQPQQANSLSAVRSMFDGYDTGVRYADDHIGDLLNVLAEEGILEQTAVIVSADHGENLGELNIYGDHQTADHITTRVPLIIRWPGVTEGQAGRVDNALHYHFDFAATLIDLVGGTVPKIWDGESFAQAFRAGRDKGRDYLVVSQGAWSCQRAVRWSDYICIRSYHDGLHGFPEIMLFNLVKDPHEQANLTGLHPEKVGEALRHLDDWYGLMMRSATQGQDPMWTVIAEGGPLHTRGQLRAYLERLQATGRSSCAERLAQMHPQEA